MHDLISEFQLTSSAAAHGKANQQTGQLRRGGFCFFFFDFPLYHTHTITMPSITLECIYYVMQQAELEEYSAQQHCSLRAGIMT